MKSSLTFKYFGMVNYYALYYVGYTTVNTIVYTVDIPYNITCFVSSSTSLTTDKLKDTRRAEKNIHHVINHHFKYKKKP